MTTETRDKVTDSHYVQRLYDLGMQLAHYMRLLGKHEEAHEVELWVLALKKELG
jgi:hypothetical protein